MFEYQVLSVSGLDCNRRDPSFEQPDTAPTRTPTPRPTPRKTVTPPKATKLTQLWFYTPVELTADTSKLSAADPESSEEDHRGSRIQSSAYCFSSSSEGSTSK
jgi:hypothetical protein